MQSEVKTSEKGPMLICSRKKKKVYVDLWEADCTTP